MANPAVGYKSYLQVGREATYGTAVSATHRFGVLSARFDHDPGAAEDASMTGSVNAEAPVATAETCTGSVTMYADYDVLLLLYDGVMGTSTFGSNGGATTGSGPYTHTWNDAKVLFNSFTMELIEGDVPTTKCALLTGVKITRASFSWSNGSGDQNFGRVTFDFVAKRKQTNQTPTGALSASTRVPVLFRHLSTVTNGSGDSAGDIKLESLSWTIENSLLASHVGGSGAYIDEPVLNSRRVPVLSWVQRLHTKTLEDAYIAQTDVNPSFAFTSGTRSFTITFAKGRIMAPCAPSIDDFGILRQNVTVNGYNGGSYACQLVVVNGKATITTA